MYSINMGILFYLFVFSLTFSYVRSANLSTKFNITIKVPVNASTLSQTPYVCICLVI